MYMDVVKGCFHPCTNSLFFLFCTKGAVYRRQSPGQSASPFKLPEYLRIYTSASDSMCSAEYKKALSIGVCKQVLRASPSPSPPQPPTITFSLFLPSPPLCGSSSGWAWWEPPNTPPSPHPPLWFWVGTSLGNWSLWALQAYPTVGWTESLLRRQLLGHPRQAERQGERDPVAANH